MKNTLQRIIGVVMISVALVPVANSQALKTATPGDEAGNPRWIRMMDDPNASFYDIRNAFYSYWQGRETHRGDGYKPFRRWEYYWQSRVNADGSFPEAGKIFHEYLRFAEAQPDGSGLKSGNAAWVELGPKTRVDAGGYVGIGRLNAIACHPTDTSIVFAGAPSGGLWKSTDGGRNWVVLTDHMPSLGVSSILIHPTRPNDILVGTGDRDHGDARGIGVIHSSDGGSTWEMYNEGMGEYTVGMMARSESDPDFVLAATNRGIFKTTNGGANWAVKYNPEGSAFKDIKMKPGNPSVAYATSTGATGFYRSEDAGETWVKVPDSAGLPNGGRMVIAVTPAAPNLVYLVCGAGAYEGCFVSQDDGKNFMLQSSSPNILGYASDGSDDKSQAWYDLCLFADPVNAQVIHVGGINLWRSDNGGKNWKITGHWTGAGAAEIHADQHTFFYNPVNKRLYAGNDGGIYYTDNKGISWKEISKGLGIGQIYRLGVSATNPYKVITGFQDNGTATWTGGEWVTSGGGDGMESAVDPTDYYYSYATIYYGSITQLLFNGYNRQVGGKGVGGIDEDGAWVTPYIIHQDDGGTMLAGYKNIWITHDLKNSNSLSWKKITNNLAGSNDMLITSLEQSPASPQMLYFARQDGRLFRTDDFNKPAPVWIDLTPGLPDQGIPADLECHPFDPATLYMAQGGKVFKSTDKGETWTNISGSLPKIFVGTLLFDESSPGGLYAGTDAGAYYRDDEMSDWVFYNTNLPASVEVSELDVYYDHLDRSKSRLRASTFGRGLWETPLAASGPILPATFLDAVPLAGKINLYWNAPFYPQYVTRYKIFRNGIQHGVSTSPYWSDDQVEQNTDYTYTVVAEYANSTDAQPSNPASAILTDPVTLPYFIDFEPSTAGWSGTKKKNGWSYGTGDDHVITGNSSHFYAIRGTDATVGSRVTDCLTSPVLDLSSFSGKALTLSFNYTYQRQLGLSKFNVVYRFARDSTWISFMSLDPVSTSGWDWDSISVRLPDQVCQPGVQIGFLYESHDSPTGGAGIDDIGIRVEGQALATPATGTQLICRTWPNPSKGAFQLEINTGAPGKVHLQIMNLSGQLVLDRQFDSGNGLLIRPIDLSREAKGIYQLRVQSAAGTWTDRITIQ